MPPATRQYCDFPGCQGGEPNNDGVPQPFVTEQGLATRKEVSDCLDKHVFRANELPLRYQEAEVTKVKANTARIEAETAAKVADRPVAPVVSAGSPRIDVGEDGGRSRDSRDRRDKLPRPQVDEGINLSDWNFFQSQWARYVAGTGLSGPSTVLHMWEACAEPLQRSLHHACLLYTSPSPRD